MVITVFVYSWVDKNFKTVAKSLSEPAESFISPYWCIIENHSAKDT